MATGNFLFLGGNCCKYNWPASILNVANNNNTEQNICQFSRLICSRKKSFPRWTRDTEVLQEANVNTDGFIIVCALQCAINIYSTMISWCRKCVFCQFRWKRRAFSCDRVSIYIVVLLSSICPPDECNRFYIYNIFTLLFALFWLVASSAN